MKFYLFGKVVKAPGKPVPLPGRWTEQSRAAFERQYLADSFYFYHSFSVIVAQPVNFTFGEKNIGT